MAEPSNHDRQNHTARQPWQRPSLWPKVKVPAQLIIGQFIGWVLRKWLG